MYKIYVSPYKIKNGSWSKKRILWAAFHSQMDMFTFLDNLRKQNPDWKIEV